MYVSMACLLRVPTVIKAELKEETRLISDDGKMGHVGVGWCSNWSIGPGYRISYSAAYICMDIWIYMHRIPYINILRPN
jgi:hypothetical protein